GGPVRAELIVLAALLGVGEHLVGLVDLLEAGLGLLVALVHVRVVLPGELAVGGLDVRVARVLRDAENLVVVPVFHGWGTNRPHSNIVSAARPFQAALPAGRASSYTRGMETKGASALVTGAGRGIGRAIALALGRAGARVIAVSRTPAELDSLVAEIEKDGGKARAFVGDLRDGRACADAVEAAVHAHDGLQILVNNAGVGGFANVAETSDEDWDRVIGTNLTAVFRLTRAALPHLSARGGHVFMISSLA